MRHFARLLTAAFLLISSAAFSQTFNTNSFHKVIISPYIEATFVKSDKERVEINKSDVDIKKLHVESSKGTLRIYLDGAKVIPRDSRDKRREDRQLYANHAITAKIYYKDLDAVSLRGDERFSFTSKISTDRFDLKLYGEPEVTFSQVHIEHLTATLYGEGSVEMLAGMIGKQSYTCYGEGKINTTAVTSSEAKLTAYGEADFSLNVSERIKITSFGEATLRYKGNAQVVKGLNVGGVDVARLD